MIPFNPFNIGYGGAGGSFMSQTLAGFNSYSGSATADTVPVRWLLVSRSRQLAISNPMAAAAIDRMTGGIVGEGLTYVSPDESEMSIDKTFADDLKKRFNLASHMRLLDAQRKQNFLQMQELACRNWLLSGDVFYLRRRKNNKSCWRAIESDRVQTPYYLQNGTDDGDALSLVRINPDNGNRIIDGVELDDDSIPVAYWILRDYINSPYLITPDKIERIPAIDDDGMPIVLHLFAQNRPDQYRGIPMLSETIESLHATTGYIRSVEQAAQFQSSVWGFITSENPTIDETEPLLSRDLDAPIPVGVKPDETPENSNEGAPAMRLSVDSPEEFDARAMLNKFYPRPKTVSAGELWSLKPGEDVKFLQPTNPNAMFGDYIRSQTGMLASAIGIPLQVLACNYDGTYSSARGSVLEANRVFKRYRGFFIDNFVRPVFEQFCYDETGDFELSKIAGLTSQWQAPTALCLDPTKELDAWTKAIQLGLATRDEAAMALYGHKATGTVEQPTKDVEVTEV